MPIISEFRGVDILETNCNALVAPVNTVAVAGAGLALQLSKCYPEWSEAYKIDCRNGNLKVGSITKFEGLGIPYIIFNFPTKVDWKNPSRIDYIEIGLLELRRILSEPHYSNTSIAIPALGCGYGGLDFENVVKPLIYNYLNPLPNLIYIYV